jgi:hypothetical protein
MSHIFISYSRDDLEFARYLRALLQAEGVRVWMDEQRLSAGVQWWDEIERNIDTCSAFVVVMSPSSRQSLYVNNEILRALDQQRPMFPVLYRGEVFGMLASLQYEDMQAGLGATLSRAFTENIRSNVPKVRDVELALRVVEGNVMTIEGDALVFKYARSFHGADSAVANHLSKRNVHIDREPLGHQGGYVVVEGREMGVANVMYVGVPSIFKLGYAGIRDFMRVSLEALKDALPDVQHAVYTMHGVGFGLDERESLFAQMAGLLDAMHEDSLPASLQTLTLVDRKSDRVVRMRDMLDELWADVDYASKETDTWGYRLRNSNAQSELAQEVAQSDSKPYVVAIMRDDGVSDDAYYFGIERPAHAQGLLCERISKGESLMPIDMRESLYERLRTSRALVVDVSLPSVLTPDVLLLIGYARGLNCPVICTSDHDDVPDYLDNMPVLVYKSIRTLEETMRQRVQDL